MGKKRNRSHKPHKTKFQHHGRKNRTKKNDLSADEWTQAQQELDQQLKKMGLYCKEIAGDGNCLFRHYRVHQFYGNTKQHSKIRKEMRKDGTYGGNMELVAFAQLHEVDIKVYQPGTIYVIEGKESDNTNNDGSTNEIRTRRTLHIIYHNWEHYSSVRNIQGPHEGDPEIISEPISTTNDSIEKMIMDSTGERNLTKIREMMKKLQFDHNEVINELIESSQKSFINDVGSNSKKFADEVINESIESSLKCSIDDDSNSKKTISEVTNESNHDGSSSKKSIGEVTNESIKSSVNDDRSNSEKDTESIEISQKSSSNEKIVEDTEENSLVEYPSQKIIDSSLDSSQNKKSEIVSKKRGQKVLDSDPILNNKFLSKKEKRKLRKKQNRLKNNYRNDSVVKHKDKDKEDKAILQLFI
ncbi:cysteine proteinase [Rhizophagus clarus]|uniref:Cysteine proteinase n=1 Tax=Rhizophagus clarus TaxID=94130 RepID=A0A8H3L931_9GLOM|nr:cysteine proteinase [Rhizophagus clarus]